MRSWIEGGSHRRARGVRQDDLPWSWTSRQRRHRQWRGSIAARAKCRKRRWPIIRRRSRCCRRRRRRITLTRRSTPRFIRIRIRRRRRFIRTMAHRLRLIQPRQPPPHGSITRLPLPRLPPLLSTLRHLIRKSSVCFCYCITRKTVARRDLRSCGGVWVEYYSTAFSRFLSFGATVLFLWLEF